MATNSSGELALSRLRSIKNAPPELQGNQLQFITRHLNHEDPLVRALAVECLWDYPGEDSAERILTLAQNDPEESVRAKAIIGLGKYMYEGEIEMYEDGEPLMGDLVEPVMTRKQYIQMRDFLITTYQDPQKSPDERRYALEALSFLMRDDVKQFITEAYTSGKKPMKISALFAMSRQGTGAWQESVLESLASADPDIRNEAIHSAGECRFEGAHNLLIHIAKTTDDEGEFQNTILAIAKLGLQKSFPFLDALERESSIHVDPEFAEYAMNEYFLNQEIRGHEENGFLGEEDQI